MASIGGVAVVSGSNKGIGLAVVRGLCRQFQGHVYLTSRDEKLGGEAVAKLEAEGLSPKYHQLDITSADSIERLKTFMVETYGGVDVLVNNAGIAFSNFSKAPPVEQATVTVQTNFNGTHSMFRAFAPVMKPHGKIVNVSSYHPGLLSRLTRQDLRDRFADPDITESVVVSLVEEFLEDVRKGRHKECGWCSTMYTSSKCGETAMAMVYARELLKSGKGVTVHCVTPGHVRTDMAGDKAPLSPDQGAKTVVMVAMLPAGCPTGAFWYDMTQVSW